MLHAQPRRFFLSVWPFGPLGQQQLLDRDFNGQTRPSVHDSRSIGLGKAVWLAARAAPFNPTEVAPHQTMCGFVHPQRAWPPAAPVCETVTPRILMIEAKQSIRQRKFDRSNKEGKPYVSVHPLLLLVLSSFSSQQPAPLLLQSSPHGARPGAALQPRKPTPQVIPSLSQSTSTVTPFRSLLFITCYHTIPPPNQPSSHHCASAAAASRAWAPCPSSFSAAKACRRYG